jgi:hypothetical protein
VGKRIKELIMQLPEVLYIHDSIWSGRKYTAGNGNGNNE